MIEKLGYIIRDITGPSLLLGEVYFDNHLILIEELGQLSQYSA
jgi:hypothetical protein